MTRTLTLLVALATPILAAEPDAAQVLKTLGERCQGAQEYVYEGQLTLLGQQGSAPGKILSQAKIRMASAPGGKFYLRIEPVGKDPYVLVSNGQKSWAWVPKLKQYTEDESASREEEEDAEDGASDTERDLAEIYARLVMPALGRLRAEAQAADIHGDFRVNVDGHKGTWPLVRVQSRTRADGSQTFTQIAVDPDTLAVGHMVYATAQRDKAEKTLVQMNLDFSSFQIGPVAASTFEFEPPKGVKLVDSVPIPGQSGSALIKQLAPDFELKTLDGEKVHLESLRGHPVLLSFWASWCGPCRHELPGLAALYSEFKNKGLIVLGINDEGKGPARKYAEKAGLSFQTLDDSGSKAHRLYRVRFIPSLFLIDAEGRVVVFLRGSKDPEKIRASLAAVGL